MYLCLSLSLFSFDKVLLRSFEKFVDERARKAEAHLAARERLSISFMRFQEGKKKKKA